MNFPHGQTALLCTDRRPVKNGVSDIGTVAVCVCDSSYGPFCGLRERSNLISVVKYGVNVSKSYTIGSLARQVGVNVETIRYYQRRGIAQEPTKPPRGIRHYTEEHARRLRFIKEAQKLGFSLDEVGELLSLEDGLHCREVEETAGNKLAIVRERIAQLGKIEDVLAVLVGKCHGNRGKLRCPLIASLESAAE